MRGRWPLVYRITGHRLAPGMASQMTSHSAGAGHKELLSIATLGPSGSNHEFVAEESLRTVGINDKQIVLFEDFAAAVEQLKSGIVFCLFRKGYVA